MKQLHLLSQCPTVPLRETFLKSPCDHGIPSTLLSALSPTLYELKKERERATSWTLPMRCSFHSLTRLFSRFLRPHRPLLLAPRALGLALSHARVASYVPTLKAMSHQAGAPSPGPSQHLLVLSSQKAITASLWPLQVCYQPHQPRTCGPACLGHPCGHPRNKRYIGCGSAYRAAQDLNNPFSP